MSELKECPLEFHDFRAVEHTRQCPRYTAVLSRPAEDGVGPEELDTLQLELETLLAAASRRLRNLETEIQILTDWQDRKGDKKFTKAAEHVASSTGKHGGSKPKKQKPDSKGSHGDAETVGAGRRHGSAGTGGAHGAGAGGGGHGPGRPKTKNLQPKFQEYEFPDDVMDEPRAPKNDAPSRFWASVEPYCADITAEEIRVLEELLKVPEDEAEYYKVPPLGKHYCQRWAQEDLQEEQRDGARPASAADRKKGTQGTLGNTEVDNLMRRNDAGTQNEQPEDACPFGPLTQRLVQALVEENIISPMEESPIPELASKASEGDGAATSPRSQAKPFSVPHTKSLEARIREELLAQGLLDSEGRGGEDSEDEVLAELRKRQAELRAVTAHNRARKQDLLRMAREEMRRQELRARARVADTEVMEAYRRIMGARQKKRTPTKKEKEHAWKVLKERESILKLLDA
ncbi:transcriptional adapter 3-like isoform X1 [Lethenteron reissneri]|uniref:transcriptional adapter 3-like isoform X1 n=1 Tax=Lethenteron reissneri TaxID=7753 RepID=UPI002AB61055|nr:transcriptional adapter 3-like isoform X1 [Lethenteron reissneri]XP_061436480.1 transcriptional adapter 3-like isoform X1 [Lethenteron reissneri]XP_061436481.1 transcriptional adapter 3-like isoform X1 [Lethenteron reissneri]